MASTNPVGKSPEHGGCNLQAGSLKFGVLRILRACEATIHRLSRQPGQLALRVLVLAKVAKAFACHLRQLHRLVEFAIGD